MSRRTTAFQDHSVTERLRPGQGDDEPRNTWNDRRLLATALRFLIWLGPVVFAIICTAMLTRLFPKPPGAAVLWWMGIFTSSTVLLLGADRVARRFLPLVALLKLSLIFPDQAPPRYKVALRTGTTRQLASKLECGDLDGTPQEAAETVLALATRLNEHDRLTRGHSERVRAFSAVIGAELELEPHERDLLNWAALVHDMGKLTVPAEILNKKGRPDDDEWQVLRGHPGAAVSYLEPLAGWLGEWRLAASEHHERWDGKGYPLGLAGNDISLAGRIVAVADAYDTMTSLRSYKAAASPEEGREELAKCAGTQFDAEVVRAFLGVSIGRLRLVAGPLSWLGQVPLLGSPPIVPVLGGLGTAVTAVVAAAGSFFVAAPDPPLEAAASAPPPVEMEVGGSTGEPTAESNPLPPQDAPNRAPVAVGETVRMAEDSVAYVQVLSNDSDPDGDPISLSGASLLGGSDSSMDVGVDGDRLQLTPPADWNGQKAVEYRVADPDGSSAVGRADIIVEAVNDAPVAREDRVASIDGAPVEVDVLSNDRDVDGPRLSVASVESLVGGVASTDGSSVTFSPDAGFSGRGAFSYTAADGAGGSDTALGVVEVIRLLHPPAVSGDVALVDEDGGTLIDVLANDTAAGSPIDVTTLRITRAPNHGAAAPVGSLIAYAPAADFSGTDELVYQLCAADGACASTSVAITVRAVNDAPSFTAGSDPTVNEDTTAVTTPGWATSISPGPTNEATQSVSFSATASNPALFSTQPAISPTGTLTYTPAANANGTSTIDITLTDNGGTTNGGDNTSATQTATITIAAVNDAPSFTTGADQNVNEDPGTITAAGWATSISPGPTNEATQSVSFSATASNPALFSTQPAISPTGTLTYTPAANANGTSTIDITLTDNGGTTNGGDNTSATQTATITIAAVNDAPSFTTGADQNVNEDPGTITAAGWATSISPGLTNEATQNTNFGVTATNPALFATQPAISPTGTLTYTPAANANGTTTIDITLTDNGGTTNGGTDTSATQTATITIAAVNDPPVANDDSGGTFTTDEDTPFTTGSVTANDTDVDDPVDPASVAVDTPPANGALVNNGDGSFDFTPDEDFNGTDVFTYTIADGAPSTSAPATVTITVNSIDDAPEAGDDSGSTDVDAPLVVSAPGILANDHDHDDDPLTVNTTPVVAPSNGSVLLGADGSYTYTPDPGFTGTDSFTYEVSDPTPLSDSAQVTITVSNTITGNVLYMGDSGPSADEFSFGGVPPASSDPVFDADGDGNPGLTIKKGGNEDTTDPLKYQTWQGDMSGVTIDGPVTLGLWSTIEFFEDDKDGHIKAWLYDCNVTCTELADLDQHVDEWNGEVSDWVYNEFDLGSVSHTFAAGHEIRLKVVVQHEDTWLAMTADYPTALTVTINGP